MKKFKAFLSQKQRKKNVRIYIIIMKGAWIIWAMIYTFFNPLTAGPDYIRVF